MDDISLMVNDSGARIAKIRNGESTEAETDAEKIQLVLNAMSEKYFNLWEVTLDIRRKIELT